MDPFHGLGEITVPEVLEDAELLDAQREEDQRRLAVEQLLSAQPTPAWQVIQEAERVAMQAEVEKRLLAHKEQLAREQQEILDFERREREVFLAEAQSQETAATTAAATGAITGVPKAPAVVALAAAGTAMGSELRNAILTYDVNMQRMEVTEEVPEVVVDDAILREKFRCELEASRVISEGLLDHGRCVSIYTNTWLIP